MLPARPFGSLMSLHGVSTRVVVGRLRVVVAARQTLHDDFQDGVAVPVLLLCSRADRTQFGKDAPAYAGPEGPRAAEQCVRHQTDPRTGAGYLT